MIGNMADTVGKSEFVNLPGKERRWSGGVITAQAELMITAGIGNNLRTDKRTIKEAIKSGGIFIISDFKKIFSIGGDRGIGESFSIIGSNPDLREKLGAGVSLNVEENRR